MARKKVAHIISGKVAPSPCPNCGKLMDGATGVRVGGYFEGKIKLKDTISMCAYCGALLVFADDRGRLRAMTPAERENIKLAPELEFILAGIKSKAAEQPDFTKVNPKASNN